MNNFFKTLLENLLLRKGPEDFICSVRLMYLCLLANFAAGMPVLVNKVGFFHAFLAAAMETAVMLLFVHFILRAFSRTERFIQSITALASVSAVLQLVASLLLANVQIDQGQVVGNGMPGLSLLFICWYLALYTHLFRRIFSLQLPAAVLLTVCYIAMGHLAAGFFLPELALPDASLQQTG
ncbi:hypothetical protein MNBD_GAMMA10-2675 [hydrothermal vent metagenome]|uniref:Yip1 domain-containing protein n=1 Tax=hydrothermal vent metagenome TaxID=652676 RepID=A0A3B0XVR1_9ZZZZ